MSYGIILNLAVYIFLLRIFNLITISGFVTLLFLLVWFWLTELCSNYSKSYFLIKFLEYYPNVDCYLACDYDEIRIGGLNVKN